MSPADAAPVRVERLTAFTGEARRVLAVYYDALGVVRRDDDPAMNTLLQDARSAMWLAYCGEEPAGCVVLRSGVPGPDAGECKRLYVRPAYRGAVVAVALMDALETFALAESLHWVYLDTNEAFAASVALYGRRGYQACARYNDNPQATLFFRKQL